VQCSDSSTCIACDSVADHRTLSSNNCVPLSGYYENGVQTAPPCLSPCATCITSNNNCLSCINRYYLVGNTCLSCTSAIPNCNQCSNSSYCSICIDGTSGAVCGNCGVSQYLDSSSYMCRNCSLAISNCQTCSSNSSCSACDATFTLNSPTSCTCQAT